MNKIEKEFVNRVHNRAAKAMKEKDMELWRLLTDAAMTIQRKDFLIERIKEVLDE